MSLGSPAWLLLLFLGALIALFHTRSRRNVQVSSLFVWQRLAGLVPPPKFSWKLPAPSLLMVLQLLVVLSIATALARPIWNRRVPRADHWIVLLDASGSMNAATEGTTRFEAARAHLRRELERLDGMSDRLSLVRVSTQPSVLAARLKRQDELRTVLETARPTDSPSDWDGAAALIDGLLVDGESARVTILSDESGAREALSVLSRTVPYLPVETLAFGAPTENTALLGLSIAPVDPVLDRWRISGEIGVFAAGDEAWRARSVPLRFLFEPTGAASLVERSSFDINLDRPGTVPFQVEITLPGAGVVEVRLPDDDLPRDNSASFVLLGETRRARVLYVGPGNPPLERALEAVEGVAIVRAETVPETDTGYDLTVLDGVAGSRRPETNTVWLGVAPDGGEAPLLDNPSPSGWSSDHPLARSVDWSGLSIRAARQLPRLSGADVLLEASGLPLIQARTTEHGREIAIAFSLQETDWPELLSFPAFVANLVRWAVPDVGMSVATSCEVGQPCSVSPRELTGDWSVIDPDGVEVPLPSPYALRADSTADAETWIPRRFETVFRPERSGLYTMVSGAERRSIAVNAPYPAESDLSTPSGNQDLGIRRSEVGGALGQPLWRWLLLAGIAVLLAEGWIAGRGTERFLRPGALSRENSLAHRRRAMIAFRILALLFLLLAILRVPTLYPAREGQAVLVVDDLTTYGDDARESVETLLATAGEEASSIRQLGMVRIGSTSRVESDIGMGPTADTSVAPEPPGSDLAGAVTLAGALLSPESVGRIVLVADGSETRGSVADALPALLTRGVPIDVYPLQGLPSEEILVEGVSVPDIVHQDEPVMLQSIIHSLRPTVATVRVLREGVLMSQRTIDLLAGRNRVETAVTEEVPGSYLYEVEVEGEGDTFAGNNRGGVLVEVRSSASVAILTQQRSWGEALAHALALQGITAEVLALDGDLASRPPSALTLPPWSDLDVAILMNLPASALPEVQQEELGRWVREDGGGLILLGGENAFGPGGYFDTPLEAVSPLSAQIPNGIPTVAISFVLDRSGSMAQQAGDETRLNIAKLATLEAIEGLDEEALIGVVVFDSEAQVVVPMQPVEDRESLRAQIEPIEPGGGTSIYPGLALAYEQLAQIDEGYTRHIVVMTDGQSQPDDFETLLAQIVDAGITVSAIAIGAEADVQLVEAIALLGGGTANATPDFEALPRILNDETRRLARGAVREEAVVPVWRTRDAPFLERIPDDPPALHGYVLTTAKEGADVHLELSESVPLLASWRYGLGRVVAFASQGAGPWAADWTAAPEYPLWWAQIVRWTLPGTSRPGLHVEVRRNGDYAEIVAEASGPDGRERRGLDVEASVGGPNERAVGVGALGEPGTDHLRLRETEPGVYEGRLIADQPGTYTIGVEIREEASDTLMERAETRTHVAYPARHEFSGPHDDLLRALAYQTGGRVLLQGEPVFLGGVPLRWISRSGWPIWTLIALALFIADLGVRYVGGAAGSRVGQAGSLTSRILSGSRN
ncbi:MAG: VWA domain-containing protein [Gemmatimonadetes bacterium]|nr:VWA domain-containing protein [Gemmatimonadota bacterium]